MYAYISAISFLLHLLQLWPIHTYVFNKIIATDSPKINFTILYEVYIVYNFNLSIILAEFAYYAGIMLNTLAILLCSGCIGSSLATEQSDCVYCCSHMCTCIVCACIQYMCILSIVHAYQVAVNAFSVTLPDYLNNWI